jgi:hypothetical protein
MKKKTIYRVAGEAVGKRTKISLKKKSKNLE